MNVNVRTILLWGVVALSAASGGVGQDHGHDHGAHGHGEGRSIPVTVWAHGYEIFAEHPFVVEDTKAAFVTHVTQLASFAPRTQGPVTFVLRKGDERLEHSDPKPARAGIYIPELVFPSAGTWSVSLHIPDGGREAVIELPAVQVYATEAEADKAPDPAELEGISFLKEQQWITPFRVEPVGQRMIHGMPHVVVPESALALVDDRSVVFVQLAGETFEQRAVDVESRSDGSAIIERGLSAGQRVVTLGAASVALAAKGGAGHADDGPGAALHLSDEQIRRFGIVWQAAEAGALDSWIEAPGEIRINDNRQARIVPRVKGVVSHVHANIGDRVEAGKVLAVIESRELADAKAAYLGSRERLDLAKAVYAREERLFQQKISSEQEYLAAKQAFAEAQIQNRATQQKLLALGLGTADIDRLAKQPAETFTSYQIKAPFDGTIIGKHIVLGEVVGDSSEVFVMADLSTVWVDLLVNQRQISSVRVGQQASVLPEGASRPASGEVGYIGSVVDAKTRTAVVRAVLNNGDGRYRPGVFATGRIKVKQAGEVVVVPSASVQTVNDQACVFVKDGDAFVLRYVTTGMTDRGRIEIVSGVNAGDEIVTQNAFHLKAELAKQAGGGQAGHGHVH